MLEGLELVFNLITRYELVERIYLQRPSSVQVRLGEAIITLYVSILQYLVKAHRYFAQKTALRIAKSIFRLEDMTAKFITTIKSKSGNVDEFVRLVSGEITNTVDRKIESVDDKLQLLALTTESISTASVRSAEMQTLLGQEIVRLEQILGDLGGPINRVATQLSAIRDNLETDERLKIFDWLSSVPYMSHHRSKVKVLLPGSGKWLLRKPEFLEWMSTSTSSILWLHGIPGSGKSMLVAHVIEYIQSRSSSETDPAPLAYFYCSRNSNEPERSDPSELMRSILEQLSCSGEDLPIREPVVEAYKAKKKEARGRKPEKLGVEEVVETVLKLLESNPATIVIDGLDECDSAKRQELLDSLETIIADSDNIVKVFLSSRDDHDLVHRLSRTPNLYIRASDNKEDIENFVKSRVDEAVAKDRIICGSVSRTLKETISEIIVQKASGMFRLASLHIDQLCNPERIKTEDNILSALANLPRDLKKSYDVIMSQILDSQEPTPSLAERILKLLHCSQQGLRSEGFIFLVCSNKATRNMLRHSDVLSICCNLVIYDEELDQFRFAHLSVREYLDGRQGYSPREINALAAEQCLRYLLMSNENKVENLDLGDPSQVRGKLSFETHADITWARYAQLSGTLRERMPLKSLLHTFLLSSQGFYFGSAEFVEWTNRLKTHYESLHLGHFWDLCYCCLSSPPNPLFVASACDFSELIATLLHDVSSLFGIP
jgi:nucleoside-triphosphatase THEP1